MHSCVKSHVWTKHLLGGLHFVRSRHWYTCVFYPLKTLFILKASDIISEYNCHRNDYDDNAVDLCF